MQETKNENLKKQTAEAVDDLSVGIKRATRKIFDACVQETLEFFSNLFDNCVEKTKEKINKGVDNANSKKSD